MESSDAATTTTKKPVSKFTVGFYIALFLISGTCSLIFGKFLYQSESIGRDGQLHHFEKPWFSNFIMFFGMTFLLMKFEINACVNDRKIKENPELASKILHSENKRPQGQVYMKVFVPAFCDFAASFIMFVGLLWIPVSIWQMIRGSIILFTGVIRQFWLKKPLKKSEWWALVVIFCSLLIVGLSNVFAGSAEDPHPLGLRLLGMFLVFISQGIQAFQTVVEEHLLQGVEAPSTMVVGMEGAWGFILTAFVALPIAYFLPGKEGQGLHEDFIDSLIMCKNSPTVLWLNIASVIVLLLFNLSSMRVTLYTNSVIRNLLEPFRTFLVWGTSVVIHQFNPNFGEGLSKWSWLQLGGFIILSIGMLMFNGTIPCCVEEEKKEEAKETLVWSVCCITIPFVVMSEKTHGSRHRSRSRGGEHRHHHHRHHSERDSLMSKHRKLMEAFQQMQSQQRLQRNDGVVTDNDAIARNLSFIMDTDVSKAANWEQRLAIRYYNRLFKEYALVDLTFYKVNKIGMRWRTEKEVVDGKGQFTCGEIHCDNRNTRELCSYEVPFRYTTRDGKKNLTLVKVRLCSACALKLYYRKIREYEQGDESRRLRRKKCATSQEVFDYIQEVLKDSEEPALPAEPEKAESSVLEGVKERSGTSEKSLETKQEKTPEKEQKEQKEQKPATKAPRKKKSVNGHSHYSSSSEDESEEESREPAREQLPEKEYDANGNEVISTNEDIWKTNVEVEHTENEKMDDFINQLFM